MTPGWGIFVGAFAGFVRVLAGRFAVETFAPPNFGHEGRGYLYGAVSWLNFLMRCAADLKGKALDVRSPSPLPHPDDIVLDYDKGVQFKGPIHEKEQARLEEAIKMRDVLIMQNALDQRDAGELAGSRHTSAQRIYVSAAESWHQGHGLLVHGIRKGPGRR